MAEGRGTTKGENYATRGWRNEEPPRINTPGDHPSRFWYAARRESAR